MEKGKVDSKELAQFCAACVEDKMAENILILPVGQVSSIADYYVLATATSEPQLRALEGDLEHRVRDKYLRHVSHTDGIGESGWILLDFGSVIVHLMTPEMREKYNLEGLWGGNINSDNISNLEKQSSHATK